MPDFHRLSARLSARGLAQKHTALSGSSISFMTVSAFQRQTLELSLWRSFRCILNVLYATMDPVSVIGLSTTAFSIVERLAKTLNFLLQLSTKLKFADVKITLLIGFLGSINAAVHEIGNIAKKLSGHIQYQKLAENLVITLDCTKVSLSFLESQLAELQSSSQDERSLVDKFTIILKDAEFESYVNGISTNVTALNLVLNALQRLCPKY